MALDDFFVWGKNGQKLTPAEIAKQREMEMELARDGIDFSPVADPLQGLARVANAAAGAYRRNRLGAAQQENNAYNASKYGDMAQLLAGGSSFPAAPASAAGIPAPAAQGEISATGPAPVDISGSRQDFVSALLPAAIEEGKRTGIDPRIIVAQAAQETGWGKSAPGNNYFGIKSHGQAGGNSMMTTEVINGQPVRVRDSFRGYDSPEASVRGYGDFMLQNPRYQAMRSAQGMDAQLEALQASGYATDPNYSRSVGAIARGIQLPQEVAAAGPMTAYSDPMVSQSPAAAAIQTQSPQETASAPPLPPPVNVSTPPAPPEQQMAQELVQSAPPVANPNVGILPVLTGQPGQTNMGGGDMLVRALQAMSDPQANAGTQGIAKLLVQQEMAKQQAAQEEQAWRSRQDYARQLDAQDPLRRAQIEEAQARVRKLSTPGSDETFFGNPVAIENQDGSISYGQIGNKGTFRPIQLGAGQKFAPPTKQIDAGTETLQVDQAGNVIARIPKNVSQTEAEKAAGKAQGEAQAALPAVEGSANEMLSSIDALLNDPYLDSMIGSIQGGWMPNVTSDARRVQGRMDQIGGQSFLQAFNMLRGAGQITEQEGAKATAAMSRLNAAQSEKDYRDALLELRGVVERSMTRAREKAGLSPQTIQAAPSDPNIIPTDIPGVTIRRKN